MQEQKLSIYNILCYKLVAFGRLAQLVERVIYTDDVGGSSPPPPTEVNKATACLVRG